MNTMKENIGSLDRVARVVLGLAIIAAGFAFHSWLGAIGLVFLGTAAVNTCPIYLACGLSTRETAAKVRVRS